MGKTAGRHREEERKARARLRAIEHHLRVTKNVCRTCRFFCISRMTFYLWFRRLRRTAKSVCVTGRGVRT